MLKLPQLSPCSKSLQAEKRHCSSSSPDLLLQSLLGLSGLQQLLVLCLALCLVPVPVSLDGLQLPSQPLLGLMQRLHRLLLLSLIQLLEGSQAGGGILHLEAAGCQAAALCHAPQLP